LDSDWSLPSADYTDAPRLLAAIFPTLRPHIPARAEVLGIRMNTTRPCGCKSFRTCIVCETQLGLQPQDGLDCKLDNRKVWLYDINTGQCINKEEKDDVMDFPGIQVVQDFITKEEETVLVSKLDSLPWDTSQSGRRKQNFGPRANFKKRKVKLGSFLGFPASTKFIQDRFNSLPILESYKPVEQCSIEYRPETGASIESHIDDCWIWGERIVQLNLLSETVLTLNPYTEGEKPKYNLRDVSTFPKVVDEDGVVVYNPFMNKIDNTSSFSVSSPCYPSTSVVRIPLPPRSLLVMYGSARYDWEHAVKRSDIKERRIVIAYRELTPPYLPGGEEQNLGAEILEKAKQWW